MRSRLIALILVPTVAAVLLGGLQVVSSNNAAADFQRVNHLAQLVAGVSSLTHELAAERDLTALYIARGRPSREFSGVENQMNRVDAAAGQVQESGRVLLDEVTGRVRDVIDTVLNRLGDLSALRKQALGKQLLPDAAIDLYSLVIADLLSLYDELGKGSTDDALFGGSLTLEALAKAKESLSRQRALLSVVLAAGSFEQTEMRDFLGALSDEEDQRRVFASEASTEERRFFDETVNGTTADRAAFLRTLVLIRANSGAPLKGLDLSKRDDAQEWYKAVTVTIDQMRVVEKRHAGVIVDRSATLESAERRSALIGAGLVGILLLAVLLITTGVAQSLVRPLRRLRSEALEIAGQRLPEVVQRLRESTADSVSPEVAPIGVSSRDEIGEVARAFDEVHREAIRLAGDEARLRSNVNAIFVNLSRRSQTLVERQLSLIERLEQGEENERRLSDLFTLDHLATRMRRNSENLLVLAGQEAARRRSEPVELLDVVRAAVSEVENYSRAVMRVQSEVALAGQSVSDIVHLLAELVENALWFSPAETKVYVSSNRIDGSGVMISVTDQGIGMTAEELAQVNWRLAEPPVVDVAASRRMGLFVVGRLALRHGIRVQLRSQDAGGLTAMVLIPEGLVVPLSGLAYPGMPGMPAPSPQPGPAALTGGPAMLTGRMQGPPAETFALDRLRPFTAPPEPPHLNAPWPGEQWLDTPAPDVRGPDTAPTPHPERNPFQPIMPSSPPDTNGQQRGGWPAPAAKSDDFLPIFAEVESHWFQTSGDSPTTAGRTDAGDVRDVREVRNDTHDARAVSWASPADAGWRAAESLRDPSRGGVTRGGLPKRVPKANLVPGTAASSGKAAPAQPPPALSPDRMRSRLSNYQAGLRQGRASLRGDTANGATDGSEES